MATGTGADGNPYETLGVPITATAQDIRSAYRRAANVKHPDKGGSDEDFRALKEAYDLLANPVRRSVYDNLNRPNVYRQRAKPTVRLIAAFTLLTRDELTITVDASTTTIRGRSRSVLRFTWNWDDGTPDITTLSVRASHDFPRPGRYAIRLRVASDSADSDSAVHEIVVNQRPVVSNYSIESDDLSVIINHVEVSQGTAYTLAYMWAPGLISTTPRHTFTTPGTYGVAVRAENSEGLGPALTKSVTVNRPPRIDRLIPSVDELSVLDIRILGDIGVEATCLYDWGDGSPSTRTPVHSYRKADEYPVAVTVTNSAGQVTRIERVAVSRPPTIVSLRCSVDDFYASISNVVVRPESTPTFRFNWGDGTTSDWPAHGYQAAGIYEIGVTATDFGGSFAYPPQSVTIACPSSLYGVSPEYGPFFRQHSIGPKDLSQLARAAAQGTSACLDVVQRLFEARALRAYAHIDGCSGYVELDERWHRNHQELVDTASRVTARVPLTGHQLVPRPTDVARLLYVLASPAALADLRDEAHSANSLKARSREWYQGLIDQPMAPELEPARLSLMVNAAWVASKERDGLDGIATGFSIDQLAGRRLLAGRSTRSADFIDLRAHLAELGCHEIVDALDTLPTGGNLVDQSLARLITLISPTAPATYRGRDISEPGLSKLAAEAATKSETAHLLCDLASTGILAVYSSPKRSGCSRLAQIESIWMRDSGLFQKIDAEAAHLPSAVVSLLRAEVDTGYREQLAASADSAARDPIARECRWFASMSALASDSGIARPVQVALTLLREQARRVASEAARQRAELEQATARILEAADGPAAMYAAALELERSAAGVLPSLGPEGGAWLPQLPHGAAVSTQVLALAAQVRPAAQRMRELALQAAPAARRCKSESSRPLAEEPALPPPPSMRSASWPREPGRDMGAHAFHKYSLAAIAALVIAALDWNWGATHYNSVGGPDGLWFLQIAILVACGAVVCGWVSSIGPARGAGERERSERAEYDRKVAECNRQLDEDRRRRDAWETAERERSSRSRIAREKQRHDLELAAKLEAMSVQLSQTAQRLLDADSRYDLQAIARRLREQV